MSSNYFYIIIKSDRSRYTIFSTNELGHGRISVKTSCIIELKKKRKKTLSAINAAHAEIIQRFVDRNEIITRKIDMHRGLIKSEIIDIGPITIPMQEDNFHVDVLAVLVQEVLEEVRDWFVGDVATHDNMSANTTNELDSTPD